MKAHALILALAALTSCTTISPGDLLFHLTYTPNHITDVTPGQADHVAIYAGHHKVIEAIPSEGVVLTPLSTMLHREAGTYVAASVKGVARGRSLRRAHAFLGLPYDSLYLQHNEAIYCSELVLLSVSDSSDSLLLSPVPMTFRDSTGNIPPYWQQLYHRHGLDVPEGCPGSNPSELMQRPQLCRLRPL